MGKPINELDPVVEEGDISRPIYTPYCYEG